MFLLRLLLWLLPGGFRREFGSELLATAAERWRQLRSSLTPFGQLRFWIREWLAVVRGSVSVRRRRVDRFRYRPQPAREAQLFAIWRDLRQGARSLAARPAFTCAAVLTLGLGVGATTAMFSAVNAVLLRALPYRNADDIVVLKHTDGRNGSLRDGVSFANMRDVARATRTLSSVSAANAYGFTLLESGRGHSVRGWVVSEGFFEAMGGQAQIGRTFVPDEYIAGHENVVVLSHRTWQTRFGGAASIVGRVLVLDGEAHTVVGVLPPEFKYPSAAELWAPRPPQPEDEDARGGARIQGVARRAPGRSAADVQAELDGIAANLATVYPGVNAGLGFRAIPLRQHLFGDVQSPLMLLLGAVGLVLLVAAANVAGLQLARSAGRSREFALRGALGASPQRILRLVSIESLILASAGGLLGIGFAHFGVNLMRRIGPGQLPRFDEVRVDGAVLSFALGAAVAAALVAGIGPALRASRMGMRATLNDGARGTSRGPGSTRLRDRLVVAEIAAALVLTIGAGLLIRSFDRLLDTPLGFDPKNRLAVQVFSYDANDQPNLAFIQRSLDQIKALPGVTAAGITTALPLADNQSIWWMGGETRFTIDDRPLPVAGSEPLARVSAIDGGYAEAMGITVKAGRTFAAQDHPRSAPVAMVNEAFVDRYFPGRDPVGQRITLRRRGGATSREVVGVLAAVRAQGLESASGPEIYLPAFQTLTTGGVTFVVNTGVEPARFVNAVQEALWTVEPTQAIWASRTMTDLLADWIGARQFNTALLLTFALLALALAAVGVYGLMSFSVEQRVSELGIRRALGGQASDILGIVLRRALALAAAGVGLGLIGSVTLSGLLQGMLFGIEPLDPLTFVVLSMLVIGVAMVAALVPARRATRIDPVVALRSE